MDNMSTSLPKPRVLWLADGPAWAYATIVKGVARKTPRYRHSVVFMAGGFDSTAAFLGQCASAEIIVCMYAPYVTLVPREHQERVVLMLTGFRPFEEAKECPSLSG